MAATPKDFEITFTDKTNTKIVQHETFSNTDVANAFATCYNNGSLTFCIVNQDCFISDIKHESGIADTTQLQLFINSRDVNVRFIVAGILSSINNRLPHPIGLIRAGSMIQLKELA